MTDILPPGWVETRLGEVSQKPQYGWTTKSIAGLGVNYLRTTDISKGKIDWESVPICIDIPENLDKFLLYDNDIVISRAGSVGISYLVKDPPIAVFASYLIRLQIINPICTSYIAYFLKSPSYWASISDIAIGIAIPNVNARRLVSIRIPIAPLEEQERIVDAIEEHFSRIDAIESAAQTALAKLDTLRRTVLAAAFSGRLVDQDLGDEPASLLLERIAAERPQRRTRPTVVADNQVHRHIANTLPSGWKWAAVNEVSHVVLGQSPPGSSYNDVGYGSPFFQGKAEFGSFYPEVRKWTTDPKKQAAAGSVLVSVRAPVGPTNIAPFDCAIGRGLAALHPLGGISTEYLLWAMRHTDTTLAKQGTGSTFDAITGAQLKIHHLPISPLAEQKRIVAAIEEHFSRIDAAKASLERCLQRCGVLRRAVLAAAFSGRLVKQDPNDEPASVLLERISAEQPKRCTRRKSA